MPQTLTTDQRQSDLHRDLETNVSESLPVLQAVNEAPKPKTEESNMSQDAIIAAQEQLADNFNAADIEGSTVSLSVIVRRWVGGSVGHLYHPGNTRFVGGSVGSVRDF